MVTGVTGNGHGETVHASVGQQDGRHRPWFFMPDAVLGGHLDRMGVLYLHDRRILAWDAGHAKEVEQVKEEEA